MTHGGLSFCSICIAWTVSDRASRCGHGPERLALIDRPCVTPNKIKLLCVCGLKHAKARCENGNSNTDIGYSPRLTWPASLS